MFIKDITKENKKMSARGSSRSVRGAPPPPPTRSAAPPTVIVQQSSPEQLIQAAPPVAPPVNPFAPYDERYWGRSEIQPANFATKGDLAFYQTAGNYAFSSDLANFQTRGNYQIAGADISASNGYFRTFGARSAGGTVGNTNPDGAVGAVIGGNIDNSWILHAPNDTRNTLFIAPGTKGTNWNWRNQMTIDKNGLVRAATLNSTFQGANVAHPDNYDGAVYRADGQMQVAVDDLVRFRNTSKKETGIQFDTRQGAGDMAGPNGIMKITRQGIMFGGPNDGTKEVNSAQISAGRHVANSLNIVGMSSDKTSSTRKVDVWAEGGFTLRDAGHAPGSNNFSFEINAPTNNAVLETSLRFHQGGKYWRQIRADNTGFRFTNGDSGTLTPIFAGDISGNNVTATGALTVAGKNVMNEINAIKAFVKMP